MRKSYSGCSRYKMAHLRNPKDTQGPSAKIAEAILEVTRATHFIVEYGMGIVEAC